MSGSFGWPLRSWAVLLIPAFAAFCCNADAVGASTSGNTGATETERGTGEWRVGPASDPDCHFQDIQDAIDAVVANDGGLSTINIRVAGSSSLHLGNTYLVDGTDFDNVTTLRIIGGHDSCSGLPSASQRTILDGNDNERVFGLTYAAGDGDPVVTMTLENLEIRNGRASFAGGGVRIQGHADRHRVRFHNVEIHSNQTTSNGSGGGISIEATSPGTSSINWVSTDQNTLIHNNHAPGDGGGIACFNTVGSSNPPVSLFNPLILDNRAVSNGGGISVNGCRNVSIRTNGMEHRIGGNEAGAFNSGGDGGGLYVTGGGRVTVQASGTEKSAFISGNLADNGAGAAVNGSLSRLELVNVRVRVNTSSDDGGGLYVSNGAELVMGRHGGTSSFPGDCGPLPDADSRCSELQANQAGSGGGLTVVGGAQADINQTRIRQNVGGEFGSSVARAAGQGSALNIEGAFIHSNIGSSSLMVNEDDAVMRVRWSTIAGNDSDEDVDVVFRLGAGTNEQTLLNVDSSIIWEPSLIMISSPSGTPTSAADCLIGHLDESIAGFDSTEYYSQIDPSLRDPANGDLRLQPVSPAVDYCDDAIAPGFGDMLDNPRGEDVGGPLIDAPNALGGAFDIGAHELQELQERLFRDRFEN